MKIIGFTGGSSVCELGVAEGVQLFFDRLKFYAVSTHPEQCWELFTDRLYKRYLWLDELNKALALMDRVTHIFMTLSNESVNWPDEKVVVQSRLDCSKKTLAEIFEVYFEIFFALYWIC